jgi:hypothetical protein
MHNSEVQNRELVREYSVAASAQWRRSVASPLVPTTATSFVTVPQSSLASVSSGTWIRITTLQHDTAMPLLL